jgi:hypothetical protein
MSSTTVHIYARIPNLCKKTESSAAEYVDVNDLIKISIKEVGKLFVKYKIHSLWKIKNFITV